LNGHAPYFITFLLWILFAAGCAVPDRPGPLRIDTPAIIRILEQEDILFISTDHSNRIEVELKDGRAFEGTYVQAHGKYAQIKGLSDVLNLVCHVRDRRPAEETKDWIVECE